MILPTETLKNIVVKSGYISESQFQNAKQAATELTKPISDILVFRSLISEEALGKLIAEHFKIPYADIKTKIISPQILKLIPEKIARKYRLAPIKVTTDSLYLAMEDPQDFEAIEFSRRHSGLKIVPNFAMPTDIRAALGQYKGNIKKEFADIIKQNVTQAQVSSKSPVEVSRAATELPVIKILNTLLEYAHAERASDLHLEVLEDQLLVRFRIDGALRDIISLPKKIDLSLVARIKILSNLKIDEHRVPQDGRFKFQIDGDFIALRVSIIPSFYGENVVLRLLSETARPRSLEELGFNHQNLKIIHDSIKQPHGMILVTGPTGSGKTTSLYSMLNILNTSKVKICTIEDPIEYAIRRVSQIQVNTQTGLTFAKGLRSLLRHDPDTIMVGEIRDQETAEIAIHSALTGHLVLSTLHTNDAPSTIPRFIDMGAEAYLLASTVNVIVAQRLVRQICQTCIKQYQPPPEVIDTLKNQGGLDKLKHQFYHGQGCQECSLTGYKGRVGVYEILKVNDPIRDLTIKRAGSSAIYKAAISGGMTTMFQDGIAKIASGITTIEEVLRVVRE